MRNGSSSQWSGKRSILDRAVSRVASAFRRRPSAGPERQSGFLEPLEERRMMYADSGFHWAQPSGTGSQVTLTYSYSNLLDGGLGGGLSATQIRSTIEEALSQWSSVAPISFVEVADSGPAASDSSYSASGNPTLRFGYHSFDGAGGTLAHGYYPSSDGLGGDVHFDSAENFSIGPSSGHIDLLYTATHEIGHALGLDHSSVTPSIMDPSYQAVYGGANTAFLNADDVSGIQSIYGAGFGVVLNSDGRLTFRGTDSADSIQFGTSGTDFTVTRGGSTLYINPASAVTSVIARGGGGNDAISMASGVSIPATFFGGDGNDTLTGGSGADTIYGGAGNDLVRGSFGNDVIQGGGDAGDQADYSTLTAGYSVAIGFGNTSTAVYIRNSSGTGTGDVSSFSGIGTFTGTNSNDYFNMADATTANYTVNGGSGTDEASYVSMTSGYTVSIGFGNTVSTGYVNSGGAWNGYSSNLIGVETFTGSNGNDFFNMSNATGANYTINGGSGNDQASYAGMTSGYTVSIGFGNSLSTAYVNSGGTWNGYYSNMSGVETFTGSTGSDYFNMSNATTADFVIYGNGGADQAGYTTMAAGYSVSFGLENTLAVGYVNYGGTWNNHSSTFVGVTILLGSGGNDYVNGANATSTGYVIYGLGGNDTFNGGGGNDVFYGGDGNDSLYGNGGNDTLYGEGGTDLLDGGTGTNTLVQ